MEFTGERYVPEIDGDIALEHLHRYYMACELVSGKDVLDIASGEGYGSSMLAKTAKSVVGVDISEEAVRHAQVRYSTPSLQFLAGNCSKIPLPDHSVDAVVSFETIEHHDQHEQMFAEIRRVLRPGGLLVISSPDKYNYSVAPGYSNPHHVKELFRHEFEDLLHRNFQNVELFGQRVLFGSAIFAENKKTEVISYRQENNESRQSTGLAEPIYWIGIASDSQLPPVPSALLEQPINETEIVKSWSKIVTARDHQIAGLKQEFVNENARLENELRTKTQTLASRDTQIEELRKQISSLTDETLRLEEGRQSWNQTLAVRNTQIEELQQQISSLTDESLRNHKYTLQLQVQLEETQTQLAKIIMSHSWKMTFPLREGWKWLQNPSLQAQRYLRFAAELTKRAYVRLPLSHQTKIAHRLFLAKHLPKLLRASSGQPLSVPILHKPTLVLHPISDLQEAALGITLKTSSEPLVSVIIPIFGKCDYTLRCLISIATNSPQVPFEIILVNDCSPDNSEEVLKAVKGLQVISNLENQGFIRSCNIGALAAKGEYLCFLNNDTEIVSDWLDALVQTFEEFPGTGLAGSKLVYPDGKLQEAGGIIWQDGSAWNFGRNQDPSLPVYNYAREVDYCSGASIMVPKALFAELGGFDEHYLPAYCEDADLALKIRSRGYRVIYQPLSVAIHHEGITSGTDTTLGIKAYQIENTRKLFERWKEHLKHHQSPGADLGSAKDRMAKYRVLVLDHCTPTPNQDAGSITVFNLMVLLREMNFQVTFIPEDNFLFLPDYSPAIQRVGVETLFAPYVTSVEQHLKECGDRYDLVFLFRPAVVERNIQVIRKFSPQAKVLFHTVDLHHLRMSREAQLLRDTSKQKAADEMKYRELAAIRAADASIVHSTAELDLLHKELPDEKLHVFPLIMSIPGTKKEFKERRDIVFVGGYQHTPNIDAVLYFVGEIMPILRSRLPGVRFYAVGSNPPENIQALAGDGVIITGFVEDLPTLLDQMRVSVAPLRFGAGIKGKIGTAMALGLPTVATPLAAEGMSLTEGKNILVADSPEAFVDALMRVYTDETVWRDLSAAGLDFADQAWGGDAASTILIHILNSLGIPGARGNYPIRLFLANTKATPSPTIEDGGNQKLHPIGSCRNKAQFEQLLQSDALKKNSVITNDLILQAKGRESFAIEGFCVPCNKSVPLLVDLLSGGQRDGEYWIPNWRERLECPLCHMNNRQRLIATLVNQYLSQRANSPANVYFMEQVTPIYLWASKVFTDHHLQGSEYLGHEYQGGTVVKGIRHEDVTSLSFDDASLDLIVSNDVFEHVPNPASAFSECARVLRSGGLMLATIPFHSNAEISVVRASLDQHGLQHHLPPMYHGNPVSAEGSLVFTDFGWDVLSALREAGFSDVAVSLFVSEPFGHLGNGQLVFEAKR